MSPLLARRPFDVITSTRDGKTNTVTQLLYQVACVSAELPDVEYVINLCEDRVRFLIASLSAIAAGQCILLPPNRQPGTIAKLIADYPDICVVHDEPRQADSVNNDDIPDVDIQRLLNVALEHADSVDTALSITDHQPAVVAFTSGSTGQSTASVKTWANLRGGAVVNARNMLPPLNQTHHMLATVPPQHMYGLELSITLPLFADICIHHGLPLFPGDVRDALQRMAEPRILVSTPTHLRAMIKSGLDFPDTNFIFSATSPLDVQLAEQAEARFNAEVVEIYGFSEAGSIACRRTAHDSAWGLFDDYELTTSNDYSYVCGDHFSQPVEVQDIIRRIDHCHFELDGRRADMINIAGKRGSFTQLNQFLLQIPGVVDGIIFDPADTDGSAAQHRKLAALVVADGIGIADIQGALRRHVDPVFMPRPILLCDQLPRTDSSKLPRDAVLALYAQLRRPT